MICDIYGIIIFTILIFITGFCLGAAFVENRKVKK